MLAPFSAGLVIYWAWSNTLSIAQQYMIMRRHGAPIGNKAKAVAVTAGASAKPAAAAAKRERKGRGPSAGNKPAAEKKD
jgi:YidC/Oxa1 family membrane protein insertase